MPPPAGADHSGAARLNALLRERADVLLAFDPGLNQLLMATGVMAGVAVSLGADYLFAQATHAMWMHAPAGVVANPAVLAMRAAQHHGATLLAMLFVGYLVGFLSRGAVADRDLGWFAAILWVAAGVNFLLKLAVFSPLRRGALRRTIQAFFARSRGVISATR